MSQLLVRVYIAISVLFLAACANTQHKALPKNTSWPLLPINAVTHIDKDVQVYLQTPSENLGRTILQGYKKLLDASPGYVPALRGLYSFYYLNAQMLENTLLSYSQSWAGLARLYPQLPPLIQREYFPPAFAAYQRNVAIKALKPATITDRLLLHNLLLAVQESPLNATVRSVLAEHLMAMGHDMLAEATLVEAARNDPLESLYPHTLANILYQNALEKSCIQDETDVLMPALSLYRKTLAINPAADVHYPVGIIYGVLGLNPLMLNEAAILAGQAELTSLWQAAYLYIYSGELDKAKQVFEAANKIADLKTQPQGRAYIDYLMLTGQWSAAVEYYPSYLNAKYTLGSYDVLLAGLMAAVAHGEDEAITFEDAWPKSNELSRRNPWSALLFELMIGDKAYSDVLENIEGDRCQRTQLGFYAGFNAWVNDDEIELQKHLSNIKALKLPFSLESLLAKTLLE